MEDKMKGINCTYWLDPDTPVSVCDDKFRVDWFNAGEGLCGDYNPSDPEDQNFLRFDVYCNVEGKWEEVEDASYCTRVPADTALTTLKHLCSRILARYEDTEYPNCSVKKLGEELSWITA